MHHREALGPADVSDETLTELVAALVREPADRVALLDSHAEQVAYALPSITTAGRYWVRGQALVGQRCQPFAFFVKHVQSWARSPLFAQVPTELAAMAEAGVPWRTEPLAYRSDLGDRLPRGLRMPRAIGVFDLDEKSASVWLEEIATVPAEWDVARFAQAAYLLGRLAASPRVRERADVGQFAWTVRDYLHGRLTHQVIPLVRDAGVWQHPLTARAFDDSLRARLQAGADRAEELVDELADLPRHHPWRRLPEQPARHRRQRRLGVDRLRLFRPRPDRIRPRPAPRRRRPDRSPAGVHPADRREHDLAVVRRGTPRGRLRDRFGCRATCACVTPDVVHRTEL